MIEAVGSDIDYTNEELALANDKIAAFSGRFGLPHRYLALHAAFPAALTPHMLYRIWANFQQDASGSFLNVPYIAVADLLLSSLCDEVGYELFQMDQVVRDLLLEEMEAHPYFGSTRLRALAVFIERFVEHELDREGRNDDKFTRTLLWSALPYKGREASAGVAREISEEIQKLGWDDGRKQLEIGRLSQVLLSVGRPLRQAGYGPLIDQSHVVRYWVRGQRREALEEGLSRNLTRAAEGGGAFVALPAAYFDQVQAVGKAAIEREVTPPPVEEEVSRVSFVNFDLIVGGGEYGYEVTARDHLGAQVTSTGHTAPLPDSNLRELTEAINSGYFSEKVLREAGLLLRQVLFPDEIWRHFVAAYGRPGKDDIFGPLQQAITGGKVIRLRLSIGSPQLIDLPWEYCFDEEYGFLALRRDLTFTRYLEWATPPLIPDTPQKTRLLIVTAQPTGHEEQDTEDEVEYIGRALSDLVQDGSLEMTVLNHATPDKLRQAIQETRPDTIHFACHGGDDYLLLEDESGQSATLDAKKLATIFQIYLPRLVILNTTRPEALQPDALNLGLGDYLTSSGVPAVIAMQSGFRGLVPFRIAWYLYTYLASGLPVDQALTETRRELDREENIYWGAPVFITRSPTPIFWRQPSVEVKEEEAAVPDDKEAAAYGVESEPTPSVARPGSIIPPDSPTYIVRDVEERIFKWIAGGDWVVVAGPWRSGKSSLLGRLRNRARLELRYLVAYLDMSAIAGRVTENSLISNFAAEVARTLGLEDAALLTRLTEREVMPLLERLAGQVSGERILVLLDEVEAIPRDARDDFYRVLRALFASGRVNDSHLGRYVFVFASTLGPSDFIQDPNSSPFNVAQTYRLPDFSPDELGKLVGIDLPLIPDTIEAKIFAEPIYRWTNGQPYLSHLMADSLVELLASMTNVSVFRDIGAMGRMVDELAREVVDDEAVTAVIRRGVDDNESESLLRDILMGERPSFSRANRTMAFLESTGLLVANEEGIAVIHNRIFELALRNTLFPVEETPPGAYSGPPLPVVPFRGLHDRSHRHPRPADIEAFKRGHFNAVLVQSGISAGEIDAYRSAGAVFVLCRIFESFNGRTLSPEEYLRAVDNDVRQAYAAGVRHFIAGNEPNIDYENPTIESGNPQSRTGERYGEWLKKVHYLLREQFSGIQLGWPALSPGEAIRIETGGGGFREPDTDFLVDAGRTSVFEECDFITCHAFWRDESGIDQAVGLVRQYRERFPDKLLYVTEATNPTGVPAGELGRQMATLYKRIDEIPSAGAFFFLVSGPGWTHTALLDEKGDDRGVIRSLLGDESLKETERPGPTTGRIYLSHSRSSFDFAQRFQKDLQELGYLVWIGEDPAKADFLKEAEEQIELADAVLVFMSPEAKQNHWVLREIELAMAHKKFIIPILIHGDRRASVPTELINIQDVDFSRSYSQGMEDLKTALRYPRDLSPQEPGSDRLGIEGEQNVPYQAPPREQDFTGREEELPGNLENFDLVVSGERDGNYQINVFGSPAGEIREPLWQRYPEAEITTATAYLRELAGRPEDIERLGQALKSFLFPGPVWSLFKQSRALSRDGLRIRLFMNNDDLESGHVPWEYCWSETGFMALDRNTPIVRYILTGEITRLIDVAGAIRILAVMASPGDLEALDLAAEEAWLTEAIAPLEEQGLVQLKVVKGASRKDLYKALDEYDPHILHFFGHGGLEVEGNGTLILERDGSSEWLNADHLMTLISNSSVRLVILNACQTAAYNGAGASAVATTDTDHSFMRLASRLVWSGLPAVIAAPYKLPVETSMYFFQELHRHLAASDPLDRAITAARIGAYVKAEDEVYWGVPALFMRSPDGVIFERGRG